MEINDLIIFQRAAELGSLSKAAESLGYVQPNVSERIKKLEMELGAPLFQRTNKGVALLSAGETLLRYTSEIIGLMEEAKSAIKQQSSSYKLGATQTIVKNYLETLLIESDYPYTLYTKSNLELEYLLKSSQIDMILTNKKIDDSNFKLNFSFPETLFLLKSKEKVVKELHQEKFFVSRDKSCPYRQLTIQFAHLNNFHCELVELDSYDFIISMVSAGKGLSFLPYNRKLKNMERYNFEENTTHTIEIYSYSLKRCVKPIPAFLYNAFCEEKYDSSQNNT
ncbi:MAG: LysR family transcriptional regulator [Bacillus sp. (in: firmicutes)]